MMTIMAICRSTSRREVTMRATATTSPLMTRGLDTAMMCSPVWGSFPVQETVSTVSMAPEMSGVSGLVPAVRPYRSSLP